jgi:hypothetical protein
MNELFGHTAEYLTEATKDSAIQNLSNAVKMTQASTSALNTASIKVATN